MMSQKSTTTRVARHVVAQGMINDLQAKEEAALPLVEECGDVVIGHYRTALPNGVYLNASASREDHLRTLCYHAAVSNTPSVQAAGQVVREYFEDQIVHQRIVENLRPMLMY